MPLNSFQTERCLNVMDKLKRRKISEVFFKPLDQAFEDLPTDYDQKITKLIDLSIIRDNLVNGTYNTVEDWKKDVNIIWENIFNIYVNNELPYLIAKELQEVFNALSKLISDDPTTDWESKLTILKENFVSLSKNGPSSIFGGGGTMQASNSLPAPSKKKSSTSSRNKKKQASTTTTNPTSNQKSLGKSDPISNQENLGKSDPISQIELNNQPEPSLISTNEPQQQNVSPDVDCIKLQEDINNYANEDNASEILNIIKKNESSYQNNENCEVEVDLELLSNKTLHLIREYMDSILKDQKPNTIEN